MEKKLSSPPSKAGSHTMSPEEHTDAIHALQTHVTEIKALVNNGLKTLVFDQKTEVAVVKENVQRMREALTSHLAKEDVILEIFRRVMSIGVTITGALVAILLSIIGYLLVNPRGFTH
jgi:type III secretory pathway lipoprotein EscJ